MQAGQTQCFARRFLEMMFHAKASLAGSKTELIHPPDWKNTTLKQFIKEVDGYIRCFNEKRSKISPGARSPIKNSDTPGIVQ
ncbi:integrase core domain-containing protein [Brucella sp. 21LCYQ03]|nr:integrase core domain-containing protein [Brucella sp. 21LCYQ03]